MKKILLMILLLVMVCGVCSAENRWIVITQSDDTTISLDTFRANSYGTKKDPYFNCWLKWVDADSVRIDHTFFRTTNNSFMVRESYHYDSEGKNITDILNHEANGWSPTAPGSVMEVTMNNAIAWGAKKGY